MELERTLRVLEFVKIREMLAAYALTDMGKETCLALQPYESFSEAERALQETEEAVVMLSFIGSNPLISYTDVREQVMLAQKGACLSPRALLDIAGCLRASRTAKEAMERDRDDTPILRQLTMGIATYDSLENDIIDSIISEEEIADRASTDLFQIRRQIRSANERMRDKLNQMIRSSSFSKNLQDSIITMRGDRYCVPVKAECRANVPGLVHDQSATGATLFIEPMFVVELGNDLKQLRAKEQLEIARILQAFSDRIKPVADGLLNNISLLTRLDFAFAKGSLARSMHACLPKMNEEGRIKIIRGRHPLIPAEKVVPSNLWLGEDFTSLIITGPNTGGKTVTLKTVGLFSLMVKSGLHIPADFGTELSFFHAIYADIGDEQSIEQSLSTFSSHMTNIVDILSHVNRHDLVLFDELGAGTDPTEGAALAQCILRQLLNEKIITMATTHYSELKAFALSTPGVENASVEFDVESLRPTYRLSIGIPGKSNAFEISKKLGLSESIIAQAKELLSQNDIRFEDVIANAEYHRQIAEREQALAEETRKETVKLRDEVEKLRREIEESREKSLRKAKEEARRILENAHREAEETIRELKTLKKQASLPEHEIQRIRKHMEDGLDELNAALKTKNEANFTPPKTLKPGDNVELVSLGTKGSVCSYDQRSGEVVVQAGIMKLKTHISQLRLCSIEKKPGKVIIERDASRPSVPMETDVRGMDLEEAINAVDRYLGEAVMAGLNEVSIIHGKGTGVLRTGIQHYLKNHLNVKKYRNGLYGEGETGVTVVTLK